MSFLMSYRCPHSVVCGYNDITCFVLIPQFGKGAVKYECKGMFS